MIAPAHAQRYLYAAQAVPVDASGKLPHAGGVVFREQLQNAPAAEQRTEYQAAYVLFPRVFKAERPALGVLFHGLFRFARAARESN